ncbi:MAG: hypothetical protein N3G78_09960 [Desulfobacterota bacterium]|nr:hypothetical protein [Thermodesulfobacteriota bacterium]
MAPNPDGSKKRRNRQQMASLLDGLPTHLPSLTLASQITQRVSEVGFDWPNLRGLIAKLDEEMEELKKAIASSDREDIQEEIGDLFFVLVNLARWVGIDPERALKGTIRKFVSRFKYIERSVKKAGKSLVESDLLEMEELWQEAKGRRFDRKRP